MPSASIVLASVLVSLLYSYGTDAFLVSSLRYGKTAAGASIRFHSMRDCRPSPALFAKGKGKLELQDIDSNYDEEGDGYGREESFEFMDSKTAKNPMEYNE